MSNLWLNPEFLASVQPTWSKTSEQFLARKMTKRKKLKNSSGMTSNDAKPERWACLDQLGFHT